MELCDCVYKWPVTEMISVSNLRVRYWVISNSQSMRYGYQTCRNCEFFLGCETPQNMHLLIYSRIFALQSIIHYRDESCQCTKKEKEE